MPTDMEIEFDAAEGKTVKSGIGRREKIFFTLSAALFVCGCLALLEPISYYSDEAEITTFLTAPVMLWSSVVLMHKVDRALFILTLLLAIVLSGIWVLFLLAAGTPGV